MSVNSESISAPAASTLVASVTSALSSTPSSLDPSAAMSLPSTEPDTVIFPVTLMLFENVPVVPLIAAGVLPPITVPSMVPPLMSTVLLKETPPVKVPPLAAETVSSTENDVNAITFNSSFRAAPIASTMLVPLVAV